MKKEFIFLGLFVVTACTNQQSTNVNYGQQGDVYMGHTSTTDASASAGIAAAPGSTATSANVPRKN